MSYKLIKNELGFLEVDPKPTLSELDDYYSKHYYQESTAKSYQITYSEEELSVIKNKISQRASLANQHNSVKKGKLLDVGCGEGFVMRHYHDKNWLIEGIDFSEFGITSFNPDLLSFFEKGDVRLIIENKIKNSKKFDIIWLGNVLEHVIDPILLLKRLKLLLNSKGTIVITVPNDGSSFQELLLNKKYINTDFWFAPPDHLSYFSYDSLINTVRHVGYDYLDIIADFPIDLFLLHSGSNYVNNPKLGKGAHNARVEMENFISKNPIEIVNSFYSNLAKLGLGRTLTIFITPTNESK
jgi:2-polyprenyl-3-methyl-5-hydroxy-6-metoxy-1,4-benzoquinol methylase